MTSTIPAVIMPRKTLSQKRQIKPVRRFILDTPQTVTGTNLRLIISSENGRGTDYPKVLLAPDAALPDGTAIAGDAAGAGFRRTCRGPHRASRWGGLRRRAGRQQKKACAG